MKEIKKVKTTLLLIIKDNKILLAKKKRGFGKDKFNGVGGKVEPNESVIDAMLRETKEEIGIVPLNYLQQATILFDEYVGETRQLIETNVFVASDYTGGEPIESEEMVPQWFDLNDVPFAKMFPDDTYWLPLILNNKQFKAKFKFDADFDIKSYSIEFSK